MAAMLVSRNKCSSPGFSDQTFWVVGTPEDICGGSVQYEFMECSFTSKISLCEGREEASVQGLFLAVQSYFVEGRVTLLALSIYVCLTFN